jgi:restriction system protein
MQYALFPEFINREKELDQIGELLLAKHSRLVVVQGAPGSGKTAFARAFLNTQDAETFWLSLQESTRVTTSSTFHMASSLPLGRPWRSAIDDATVSACSRARYVVVDDVDSTTLGVVLDLTKKCPKQQFILLSAATLDLPAATNRIVLPPLAPAEVRQLVETWASALKVSWTSQQVSDFIERYTGPDANPRRILQAVDAMREAGGFEIGLQALHPFVQTGLLDASGKPLSTESIQFTEFVSNVKFVNSRILDNVRHDPSLLYSIDSRDFELLVAELLSEQGFRVDVTRSSRDGGVDMWIAENRSIGSFRYLVECKKYSAENKVGVKIVREVFGTLQASRATAGLIVTTSYFTRDAKEFAEQVRYQLSLRDYVDIRKWLGMAQPKAKG